MMKKCLALLVMAFAISAAYGEMKCRLDIPNIPKTWIDMKKNCYNAMRNQIQMEIDASYTYLAMGAHFSRDVVNRPGFASFFFNAAKEERDHGSKLIDYLSMRGKLTDDVSKLIKIPTVSQHTWASGNDALKDALELETKVTQSIRNLIKVCEKDNNYNHYHLVDYLTGVYLEEQLKGQRELAGRISTLGKMMDDHGPLGEFLYDKEM